MSDLLDKMRFDLKLYKALKQHQPSYGYLPELKQLQAWQADRLRMTHSSLLHEPGYHDATEFVLNDVYGGIDLYHVVVDIDRALPVVVRLFSSNVMKTASIALELNALTGRLDEELMEMHFHTLGYSTICEESYIEAYRACDHFEQREHQVRLAQSLGYLIDQYIASRVIYMGFKMAKSPAHAAGLHALYDFMGKGFEVLRPLGSAHEFLMRITQPELHVIERIKLAHESPFEWSEAMEA